MIWDQANLERETYSACRNHQDQRWEQMVLRKEWQSELEQQLEKLQISISELIESMQELENVLLSYKSSQPPMKKEESETTNELEIDKTKPKEASRDADDDIRKEGCDIDNQEELGHKILN
ncbi:hypothetical protein OXYTRIMIC_428 [Oxytricha trifallax]|uniref:Uncharacterized protein n=1 Tax=Oxytricha trifallax TaxID=1172189 RepID=A0A073ICP5_9SPIT|nr:hypothetical protein OXYTRIMIC_428 [Oxytricha trifallax]